ncbi:hypothetical protein AB0K51_33390 [Kitasatospora sp. NPDC049285]|uniref:hypothetical protein n=1 Tax=Kitasatospora sp. NPDC049285 TaxID=3157096 RepID=UPI00343CF16C
MPICTGCGAASARGAASCANCGDSLTGGPAIGPVVESEAPAAASPWGAGRVHQARDWPVPHRGWLTAGKLLLAPTGLLLAAAVLGSASSDEALLYLAVSSRFQVWMSLTLTAFGAPWTSTLGEGPGTSAETLQVLPYAITLGWLAALWLGLRLTARSRLDAGADANPRAAAAQALRVGAVSAAVALLLGLLSTGNPVADLAPDTVHAESGVALLPLALSAGLAAAGLAFAVDAAPLLRAAAARRRWLGGWLLAWQHAARVTAGLLAALTAVALVLRLVADHPYPLADHQSLTVNGGLFVYAIGSGARTLSPTWMGMKPGSSFALYDLAGHGAVWWLAAAPVLLAALALGWSAHRGRLALADRARLAVLYTALPALLVLGTTTRLRYTQTGGYDLDARPWPDLVGWSVTSVLAAGAAWAVFGALLVPAVLDALRRTPAPVREPDAPEGGSYGPEGESYGLVEVAAEPEPAVAHADLLDSHDAYRRPLQGS